MAPSTDPAYHGFLRVGHMGHVNAHMTLGALAVMEAGMIALDIPHGAGRWRRRRRWWPKVRCSAPYALRSRTEM